MAPPKVNPQTKIVSLDSLSLDNGPGSAIFLIDIEKEFLCRIESGAFGSSPFRLAVTFMY
jgi:hypothetical protein